MSPVLKTALTVRADSLYCPLAFGLDTYWQCPYDCTYCYCRGLNYTWGQQQRAADPESIERQLVKPSRDGSESALAAAIRQKKTLRFGNKADPFPPEELGLGVSKRVLELLQRLHWSYKLETRSLTWTRPDYYCLLTPGEAILTMTATCGLEADWQLFEHNLPAPAARFAALQQAARDGFQVGVISEPFIPGWHTVGQWSAFLDCLLSYGIRRVNTYNMHFTPFVAKRMNDLPGIDIERVWRGNQDGEWGKVLPNLIAEAARRNMTLGCPDFVNSGNYIHSSNTCCGVDAPRPTTFNYIHWKNLALNKGCLTPTDISSSWDGVGDKDMARQVKTTGGPPGFYSFRDLGWFQDVDGSWRPGPVKPKKTTFF